MYKWFALKRIGKGVITYVIIMFILSALFNTVVDNTMRASIEEQVRAESVRLKNLQPEALQNFQQQRREALISLYRLDRPMLERIMFRTWNTITFNFGKSTSIRSSRGDREVLTIVGEAIPRTVLLFTVAAFFEIVVGIILGLKKAQKPGGFIDRSSSFITMIVYGMPTFWLAMILIMFFVYQLKLFPSGGIHSIPTPQGIMYFIDMLWHMALPMLTLVLIGFWGIAFVVRNIVLGILQDDYIMAARARGIPEQSVLFKHTLRTAAPPLITMSILSLLSSISGAIIFEGIFSWPGLGNLYWIAVQQNDIPVLMANLAITVGLYQIGLILLDLTYGFMDPRIKVGGK
ncbi:ABC transporter permease [Treponema sp. J25]|uniref:ABC transporter permease n=1 Tax=Treponema sp. J25 TaxID=2094121 RepID=UPI00104CE82E|nr:ABC transporter permease [Treponema sp. J25]TCW61841.1 ABC transporter permease [Treponema sp. J25]